MTTATTQEIILACGLWQTVANLDVGFEQRVYHPCAEKDKLTKGLSFALNVIAFIKLSEGSFLKTLLLLACEIDTCFKSHFWHMHASLMLR